MTTDSVQEISNRDILAAFLKKAPIPHSYPLGYLDPAYEDHCRWFALMGSDEVRALVLLYEGLARPGIFTAGCADGMREILRRGSLPLPHEATGHIAAEHLDTVRSTCRIEGQIKSMSRMGLSAEDFEDRRADLLADDVDVVRLTHRDTGAIMRLYRVWPDHFFEPFQLETGLYFGIRGDDGDLACIAGTHTISSTYGIAAIGNLVTHTEYRRRGYARLCTARLLREVFQRVGLVTLDVQHRNEPAIRTYQHFGFKHYSDFYETHLVFPNGVDDD